jgi:hypothetical protein
VKGYPSLKQCRTRVAKKQAELAYLSGLHKMLTQLCQTLQIFNICSTATAKNWQGVAHQMFAPLETILFHSFATRDRWQLRSTYRGCREIWITHPHPP